MGIFTETISPSYFQNIKASIRKYWHWYMALGVMLIIIGIMNITMVVITTLVSVVFFGAILLVSAFAMFFHSARFWKKKWSDFFLHLFFGLIYGIGGFIMIIHPVLAAVSLTLALAILYIFLGISRIIYSLAQRLPGWGWMLTSGIISLILGILIWYYWPINSLWIIGLFVSIDIIFIGWWLIMLSWSARTDTSLHEVTA